jgi:hypothetical protein
MMRMESYISKHTGIKHSKDMVACPYCEKMVSQGEIYRHIARYTDENVTYPDSMKIYPQRSISKHIMVVHKKGKDSLSSFKL